MTFGYKQISIPDSNIPIFEVSLKRQYDVPYKMGDTVANAASILHSILDDSPVEKLVGLYMSNDKKIIGAEILAIGEYDRVITTYQNIIRGAVISGAPYLIIGHNHVTGPVVASDPDLEMTGLVLSIGSLLNIVLYDHIIVGPRGEHYSIFEHREECLTQNLRMRVASLIGKYKSQDPLAAQIM